MISTYYGYQQSAEKVRQMAGFGKEGVSLLGINEAAENLGFRTRAVQVTPQELFANASLPCILHWNQNHFVVLPPQTFKNRKGIRIADPARGIITLTKNEFLEKWCSGRDDNDQPCGLALLVEPTEKLEESYTPEEKKTQWTRIFVYLKRYYRQFFQIFLALTLTSVFQLIAPFLTQSIVDTGINTQNLQFVTIVLIAQMMLIISRTVVEFVRSRLVMEISTSLNFALISDFWIKLTRLPISYFDNHKIGDTIQRIGDSKKIENFLTSNTINTIFSLFNFILFAIVLMWYNAMLFSIFLFGSIIYFFWIRMFLRVRRKMNYESFGLLSKESNLSFQLIQGMQELKLNNAESMKRWEWENVQSSIFKIGFRNLSYAQIQQGGALLINESKNIFITFLVAQMVIKGELTLGAMLAVQYIIGQLNGPVEQFVGFVQNAQDIKISLERLNEVHKLEEEENISERDTAINSNLPDNISIKFDNVSFAYPGAGNRLVLNSISLEVPANKMTAIVGASGSGKTTLLKILLKFYNNYDGGISLSDQKGDTGSINFNYVSPSYWRSNCGAVLQDGYIFNDTIAHNIALGVELIDIDRLLNACKQANILDFIESLPNGFNTILGRDGSGISQGQKQRLLIARVIYRDPKFIVFDEATNALDANNESKIVDNLNDFFVGKTVIVVAHRLSTVKHADNIIVLHNGRVAESGTHSELAAIKGKYYELVSNQLELGK